MTTFQQVVDSALLEIGAIAIGESPTTDETAYALDRFSWLLDNLSIAGLMQAKRSRQSHAFTESKIRYSISSTAADVDIALDLPADLDEILYRSSYQTDERPMDPVSLDALSRHQNSLSNDPYLFLIEKSEPAVIHFDSMPLPGDVMVFVGRTWLVAARGAIDAANEIGLPRGYDRPLVLGLAMELAPSYGVSLDTTTEKNMTKAKAQIRTRNRDPSSVAFDPGMTSNSAFGLGQHGRGFLRRTNLGN